jgi:hypothetical protein
VCELIEFAKGLPFGRRYYFTHHVREGTEGVKALADEATRTRAATDFMMALFGSIEMKEEGRRRVSVASWAAADVCSNFFDGRVVTHDAP